MLFGPRRRNRHDYPCEDKRNGGANGADQRGRNPARVIADRSRRSMIVSLPNQVLKGDSLFPASFGLQLRITQLDGLFGGKTGSVQNALDRVFIAFNFDEVANWRLVKHNFQSLALSLEAVHGSVLLIAKRPAVTEPLKQLDHPLRFLDLSFDFLADLQSRST